MTHYITNYGIVELTSEQEEEVCRIADVATNAVYPIPILCSCAAVARCAAALVETCGNCARKTKDDKGRYTVWVCR